MKVVCFLLALVLIGGFALATPRPVQADALTYYTVTLKSGLQVLCPRVVYEVDGRLECISGYHVTHYERGEYSSVQYVVYPVR